MKITIIIPVYNEEKHIKKVLKDLAGTGYPVFIIDDGSSDNSYKILSKYPLPGNYQVLRHKVNLGKGAAMKTGAEAAFKLGADAVVFMDSDGQHMVADLPNFINKLEKKSCGIVYGSRNLSHGVPLVRYLGNKLASLTVSLLYGEYVSDILCGFRAVTKEAYEKMRWESRGYAVESEMVVKAAKAKIIHCEVPVSTIYYDKFKGVTVIDAAHIFLDLLRWRLKP